MCAQENGGKKPELLIPLTIRLFTTDVDGGVGLGITTTYATHTYRTELRKLMDPMGPKTNKNKS